ncbi:MAG: hypothetical protein M1822_008999 [Bathelium mastoideum]|nr:MAG: hypothetical protein M1822_008999 [Bathelium mastoideum]
MKHPAAAPWDVSISDADFEKLKAGFTPRDMDDKWVFRVTDLDQSGNISIHLVRSWTDTELYVLAVKPRHGGSNAKIEAITWEQSKGGIHVSEVQGKKDAVILCRAILGCDFDALPHYDFSLLWNHPAAQINRK